MKLLFVTMYVDHVLLFFLRELAEHVSLRVVYDFENRWNTQLAEGGVSTTRLVPRSRFDRRFRAEIERLYAEETFDLVQCFHGNAQLANLIRWNLRNIPLVGYRGRIGHLKFRESPAAYWSVRNPSLSAVVANSSAVASYLESFRLLKPRNVHVITTGVNPHWIRERCSEQYDLRPRLGLSADAFIVAGLGSLRPVKNFQITVAAAKALAPHGVHFVNVGDPRGWDRRTRGIENIHYIEFTENPFPIIAEADVFASTSHGEAFGRVSLEAMACGKPVVGPRAGGSLDLIEDGHNGRFFEPRDAEDFAAKLLWYFESRDRAPAHGANALRSVEARFSTRSMVDAYLSLYKNLLGQ